MDKSQRHSTTVLLTPEELASIELAGIDREQVILDAHNVGRSSCYQGNIGFSADSLACELEQTTSPDNGLTTEFHCTRAACHVPEACVKAADYLISQFSQTNRGVDISQNVGHGRRS